MRLIGHLPEKSSALTFSDFLYVQGIGNDVESEKEGWAIWIHGEDEVSRARQLFEEFRNNPSDAKYQKGAAQAGSLKLQERLAEVEAKDRYFDKSKLFRESRPYGMGPLTLAIVLICVGVFVAGTKSTELLDRLYITHFWIDGAYIKWERHLPEIRSGQYWRLITPIFMHNGPVHLIFNSLAMLDLGSMIEARRGSVRLFVLIIVLAIASNLAQYGFSIPSLDDLSSPDRFKGIANFCGISGVVFGLMGYAWMKSKFDPNSGLFMPRQSVIMMLVWFVICLLGVMPNVRFANTAHAVGLLFGMLLGYLPSLFSKRRSRLE